MRLYIFEDKKQSNFLPLTWFRPVYFLPCGMTNIAEKIRAAFPGLPVSYLCREYLKDTVAETTGLPVNSFGGENSLLINGRLLMDQGAAGLIDRNKLNHIFVSGDEEAAIIVSKEKTGTIRENFGREFRFREIFPDFPVVEIDAELVNYPWELINRNGQLITADFSRLCKKGEIKGKVYAGAHLLNPDNVYIGEGTVIKPGVVIDAENWPVFIGSNVTVMPNSVIEGPVYIGNNSIVKIGAKIYENTSIGETCKVGGEIDGTIMDSFCNKQHDGFLGHSFLGRWINIGADTNNSDLKNNYKNVRVTVNGKEIDTGSRSVGLIMGDHSKAGINTMFNTGTVVGVHCNVYGSGFPPKYIPSFSWGGSEGFMEYKLDKAVETAGIVMSRRNMELSGSMSSLYGLIFEKTAEERQKYK